MTRYNVRPLLHGGLAAVLLASSVAVLADPVVPPAQAIVATRDIDLTSSQGVETLRKRVAATVRWACGPVVNWTPAAMKAMADCRAEAAAEAEPMVRRAVANGSPRFASN